ncbi:MAG: prepilin-type N-terminal cleavage/methylation domain-containing protein [Gammaproteobacteria bacterium]|nr:prepilin-type N-terminal cleavage/methylation domain-containing protein [Gammaproteobacteria bacterium]
MKRQQGFTLTELMIAMAIVAIVAAVAYPSYQDSMRKSRRADARAVMLEAAQFMERFYTENLQTGYTTATQTMLDNNRLGQSPKDGGPPGGYYVITLGNLAQNTFTLTAVPQTTGGQNHDACLNLTLNQAGVKGTSSSKPVDECWR